VKYALSRYWTHIPMSISEIQEETTFWQVDKNALSLNINIEIDYG